MKDLSSLSADALRQDLLRLTQRELVELVVECSSLSKEVENHLAARFKARETADQLYRDYRKRIESDLSWSGKIRMVDAENAVREFQLLSDDRKLIIDLMLFYVELVVHLINYDDEIDERFYDSIEIMFGEVVRWLNEEDTPELYMEFEDRLDDVVQSASDNEWGLYDDLLELYHSIKW